MAWIRTIEEKDAEGDLARQYASARKRAGKIYNIVKLSSLRPEILGTSIGLYLRIMHGPGKLSRAQREMIAVVVSRANGCFY